MDRNENDRKFHDRSGDLVEDMEKFNEVLMSDETLLTVFCALVGPMYPGEWACFNN